MSIPAIEPVSWEPHPVQGTVDTKSEAVSEWMNTNDITDLTQLSSAQIEDLVQYLKNLSTQAHIPGLNNLIASLEGAQPQAAPGVNSTEVELYASDLKSRAAVLTELGQVYGNQSNPFTKAAESLQQHIVALDALITNINASPVDWSTDPAATQAQMQTMINQIKALKEAGVPTAELGLDAFAADMQKALNDYVATVAAIPDQTSAKAPLALSNLRESFSAAKVEFFTSTGVSSKGTELSASKADVRLEELRQRNILAPSEDTTAVPKEISIKELDASLVDLDLQYQLAVIEGNRDAMKHIEAKMEILGNAREMLVAGNDPLLVGIVLFQNLRVLDITAKKVTQARLREEAVELQKTNDPALDTQIAAITSQADAIDTEIDALIKQISQVQEQYESVLNTWVQNINESLSKAF